MKNDHEEEVRARVIRALEEGFTSFSDVLSRVDGADPRLVARLLAEHQERGESLTDSWAELSSGRSEIFERLPAWTRPWGNGGIHPKLKSG